MLNDLFVEGSSTRSALPSLSDYFRQNPKSKVISVGANETMIGSGLEDPISESPSPATVSATKPFSSLEEFNELVGDIRYQLALKKITGRQLSPNEETVLAILNETFRALLSDRPSEDAHFLRGFVEKFELFDVKTSPKQADSSQRSRK